MRRTLKPWVVALTTVVGATTMAAYAAPTTIGAKDKKSAATTTQTAPEVPPAPPPVPNIVEPTKPATTKPVVAPPGVAATVNGEDISVSKVSEIAMRMAGANIVENLINNALVDQEAKKQKLDVTPEEIDAKINEIRDQMKPMVLEDALKQRHMLMSDLRDNIRVRVEIEKLLAKNLKPVKMVHVRHILVKIQQPGGANPPGEKQHTEAEANAIIKKIQDELKAGAKFEDLAKKYSEDPSNKDKGGDLGVVTETTPFDPGFLKAAMALKKGEVTATPAKSFYGLHLIKCDDTGDDPLPADKKLFDDASKQAKEQQIQSQAPQYVQGLRASAKVTNYLAQ